MRNFTVDFKTADIGVIGRKGEHNYPVLEFKLDEDFKNCDFIVVELGINGRKIPAESIEPTGETLTFKLTKQLSKAGHHHAQLVGYVVEPESAEPQEIMKSPVVHFSIEQSIGGIEQEADSNPSLFDRILAKVHMLLEKAHQHANLKILELFACPALTDPFAVGLDADRLRFNSSALRYISDGTVIKRIKQIEKDGKQCVRLYFYEDAMVTHQVPEFIDLLVSGSTDIEVEDNDTGLKLNGIELDFGISDEDDFCTLPIVSALPAEADEGDIVLYAPPANTITADNAGSTVCLDYSWIDSYDGTECSIDFSSGSSNYSINAGIYATSDFILMHFDSKEYGGSVQWFKSEGSYVLDTENSLINNEPVSELIGSIIVPEEFEEGYNYVNNNGFPYTWFYIKPELYVYCNGQWKLISNETAEIAEIRTAIDEIKGGIDEIEAMIDESGVLE